MVTAELELRDKGHGITTQSLEYWNANKDKIGDIVLIRVTEQPMLVEGMEYNFMAQGTDGTILLSGCNCGYGGTGPNGTAKILAELGLPMVAARKAMMGKVIEFCPQTYTLTVDGEGYEFPMSDLRRETTAYDEFLQEVEWERAREVLDEMKYARNGDDGEFYDR